MARREAVMNRKSVEYCGKRGVFPFDVLDSRTFVYYALSPCERTVYRVTVVDGVTERREPCADFVIRRNKAKWANARENQGH